MASQAPLGFSTLTLLHIFSVSVTCNLRVSILLVVLSFVRICHVTHILILHT